MAIINLTPAIECARFRMILNQNQQSLQLRINRSGTAISKIDRPPINDFSLNIKTWAVQMNPWHCRNSISILYKSSNSGITTSNLLDFFFTIYMFGECAKCRSLFKTPHESSNFISFISYGFFMISLIFAKLPGIMIDFLCYKVHSFGCSQNLFWSIERILDLK